jgi:hypothetical protein
MCNAECQYCNYACIYNSSEFIIPRICVLICGFLLQFHFCDFCIICGLSQTCTKIMYLNVSKKLWHKLSRLFIGNGNHLMSVYISVSIVPDSSIWSLFNSMNYGITEYRRRKECRVCVPVENFRQESNCCLVQVSCITDLCFIKGTEVCCQWNTMQTKSYEINLYHTMTEYAKKCEISCWNLHGKCLNTHSVPLSACHAQNYYLCKMICMCLSLVYETSMCEYLYESNFTL